MDEAYEGEAQHIQQQIADEQAWIRDILNRLPKEAGGNGSTQAFHEPGVTDGGCVFGGPEHQMLQDSLAHHLDELRMLEEKAKAKGIPLPAAGQVAVVPSTSNVPAPQGTPVPTVTDPQIDLTHDMTDDPRLPEKPTEAAPGFDLKPEFPPIDDDDSFAKFRLAYIWENWGRRNLWLYPLPVVIGFVLFLFLGPCAPGNYSSSSRMPLTKGLSIAGGEEPPNTVLASCYQIEVKPGSSTFIETFRTAPMSPGLYRGILATGLGSVSGETRVAPGAVYAAIPFGFTQFTKINSIKIDGPNGAIANGTIASQLPFQLNAESDHSTDCDGAKLVIAKPGASGTGIRSLIASALDRLASDTHSAAGVDHAVATLDSAVTNQYGIATCRSFIATTIDPTAKFEVVDFSGPDHYTYVGDGHSTVVPNVYTVKVRHTQNGVTKDGTVHLARNEDGTFSWFTRCKSG